MQDARTSFVGSTSAIPQSLVCLELLFIDATKSSALSANLFYFSNTPQLKLFQLFHSEVNPNKTCKAYTVIRVFVLTVDLN